MKFHRRNILLYIHSLFTSSLSPTHFQTVYYLALDNMALSIFLFYYFRSGSWRVGEVGKFGGCLGDMEWGNIRGEVGRTMHNFRS